MEFGTSIPTRNVYKSPQQQLYDKQKLERRLKFHYVYLNIAKEIATLSRAERRKVGALIVKDNNILSFGFNGTPVGFSNKCEDEQGKTVVEVLHAETNAIAKAATSTVSTRGATLYLTFSPCMQCSKLILQSGIEKVYYIDKHSNTDGIQLLLRGSIQVTQIKGEIK